MSFLDRELPYAWPAFGWPRLADGEVAPSTLELWLRILPRLSDFGQMTYYFAYVAVDEDLPIEESVGPEAGGDRDPVIGSLRDRRSEEGREPATRQITLDMIEADHFLDRARHIPPCPINDAEAAIRRRGFLDEVDLLNPERLSIATLLLSGQEELEAGYIANFLPSTWHRVAIGREIGLPLLQAPDYDMAGRELRRLAYAAPVTFAEANSLTDIISLNHLPDAGG